jgi:hypothetical protein
MAPMVEDMELRSCETNVAKIEGALPTVAHLPRAPDGEHDAVGHFREDPGAHAHREGIVVIVKARRSRRTPIRDEDIHFVGHAQKQATAANRTTMGMRLAVSAYESVRMAEMEQGIEVWQASHLAASQRTHGGARGVVPASRRIGTHRHFGL